MAHLLYLICTLLFAVDALASVHFTWPYWTFKSVPIRPPKLEITKSSEAAEPGLLFIGPKNNHIEGMLPNGGSTATIYDQDGNLIWKGPNIQTTNLRVQTLFGQPVLTYWSGTRLAQGYAFGAVHILDQTYKEIYTVTLKGNYVTPPGINVDSYIDLHESKITDRDTIIVTAYNLTQVDTTSLGGLPDTWVLKSEFHEIDIATNEILFSWSPLDHPTKIPFTASRVEVYGRGESRETPWDLYHINSVDVAASGYVVSLRHCFSVSYINRDGSIKWHLDGRNGGDFDLCETCRFSWQHDVRLFDETPDSLTLTLFNNDGREGPDKGLPTTGLVLGVDQNTMTVTSQRRLIDPKEHINTDTQGSLQVLDGNTAGNILIGYGSWATMKEFNALGESILTVRFGPAAQIASYRCFKFDWHATPQYPPDMVVTAYKSPTSHMSTHFYVSWNGATDIVKWNFYAQASQHAHPILIGSVPKTGFETMFTSDGYMDWVSVEAVHVNGTALGRSRVQKTTVHGGWTASEADPNPKQEAPKPDDPSVIVAATANQAPDPTPEDAHDKGTIDSYKNLSGGLGLGGSNQHDHGEENQETVNSEIDMEPNNMVYEIAAGIGILSTFLVICSVGCVILASMSAFRRKNRAWYEWIPSREDLSVKHTEMRNDDVP